jgi:predicted PurR-regulated permease PerM
VYTVVLSLLGVHYSIGLALIAGFASFLPYIGPAINWIVLGLVTYFQGSTIFGLSPFGYVVVTIIVALVIDQVFDNLVAPRVMAHNLRVHPAFVLIAAIIAANLVGLLGVIIAAPLLATFQLIGRYTMRKLLDKDPWPPEDDMPPPPRQPRYWRRFLRWLRSLRKKTT